MKRYKILPLQTEQLIAWTYCNNTQVKTIDRTTLGLFDHYLRRIVFHMYCGMSNEKI
jgi:hypothetical protein